MLRWMHQKATRGLYLPQDNLMCRLAQPGIKPPTCWLVVDVDHLSYKCILAFVLNALWEAEIVKCTVDDNVKTDRWLKKLLHQGVTWLEHMCPHSQWYHPPFCLWCTLNNPFPALAKTIWSKILGTFRTLTLCENQSSGTFNTAASHVLTLLSCNDQLIGCLRSFYFCWMPQGFLICSVEAFHLWIFHIVKCS